MGNVKLSSENRLSSEADRRASGRSSNGLAYQNEVDLAIVESLFEVYLNSDQT